MVIKEGAKMSKSKGNIVDPDKIIEEYGADTARLFMLFASPPEKDLDWSDKGVEGCSRFIGRVWRVVSKYAADYTAERCAAEAALSDELRALRIELHRTMKIVTHDIEERLQYNTAIARLMELVNALYQLPDSEAATPDGKKVLSEVFDSLIPMLSPFVPHVAEEMWAMLGHKELLVNQPWPAYIEALSVRDEIEIVFQVNGKNRSKAPVAPDISKDEMERLALADQRIGDFIAGKQVVKVIVVPGKLVNIVVK